MTRATANELTQCAQTPSGNVLRGVKPRSRKTGLHPKAQERLLQIPKAYQATYRRAMGGKSFPAAVKAHCQMCMGWEDVVNGIRNCTDPACPLYAKRPYQARDTADEPGGNDDDAD